MNRVTGNLPRTVTIAYLVLVILSALPLVLPNSDALSGIFLVVMTFPWSGLNVVLFDAIDPNLLDTGIGLIGITIGALLNASIIYAVTNWCSTLQQTASRNTKNSSYISRKIKLILHGSWTGAVASFIASYLLGVLFFVFGGIPDYELSDFIPISLVIGLTSLLIGVPIGVVVGVVNAFILNSIIHSRLAVHFGIISGAVVAIGVMSFIYLGRLPDNGTDIAGILELISGSALVGAIGGYVFARLFVRYGLNQQLE